VSFNDDGNGAATLSGTSGAGPSGAYPFTITASNGVLPNGTQSFTLTLASGPWHHFCEGANIHGTTSKRPRVPPQRPAATTDFQDLTSLWVGSLNPASTTEPIAEVQRASSVRVTYLTFGAVRAACVSAGSGTPIGPASFFQIADSARVPTRRGDSNTCRSGACTRL
jgi:hypothetical protein